MACSRSLQIFYYLHASLPYRNLFPSPPYQRFPNWQWCTRITDQVLKHNAPFCTALSCLALHSLLSTQSLRKLTLDSCFHCTSISSESLFPGEDRKSLFPVQHEFLQWLCAKKLQKCRSAVPKAAVLTYWIQPTGQSLARPALYPT